MVQTRGKVLDLKTNFRRGKDKSIRDSYCVEPAGRRSSFSRACPAPTRAHAPAPGDRWTIRHLSRRPMDLSRDGKRRSYESTAFWPSEGPNRFRRPISTRTYVATILPQMPSRKFSPAPQPSPEDGGRGLEAARRATVSHHLRTLRSMGYAGACDGDALRERERSRVAASQRRGESSAGCGRRKTLPPLLHRRSPTPGVVEPARIHHADGLPGWHPAARSSMDGISLNQVHAPTTQVFRRMS